YSAYTVSLPVFLFTIRRPLTSTLFPYTTLFRSLARHVRAADDDRAGVRTAEGHIVGHGGRIANQRMRDRRRLEERTRIGDLRERSEEHTSELQSPYDLVCRLLLEKKKTKRTDPL